MIVSSLVKAWIKERQRSRVGGIGINMEQPAKDRSHISRGLDQTFPLFILRDSGPHRVFRSSQLSHDVRDYIGMASSRSTPTDQNQVFAPGHFRQPMQFPIHRPTLYVLLPQPAEVFLYHRFAIPVASDPKCISQYARAPHINALAVVGVPILNSNLKHNHLLSHDYQQRKPVSAERRRRRD